jgi:hypothetical protein
LHAQEADGGLCTLAFDVGIEDSQSYVDTKTG